MGGSDGAVEVELAGPGVPLSGGGGRGRSNREDAPALVSKTDGGHGGLTDTGVVETGAAENKCVGGSQEHL